MAVAEPQEQQTTTISNMHVVATGVSEEDYLKHYAEHHHEWVNGVVIKVMSPVHENHDMLSYYIRTLLENYFAFKPIGKVRAEPFVLRMPEQKAVREPDLQVILNDNPNQYTPTAMIGASDICIEIVSPESTGRDRGDKFKEYEEAGVKEYWIIDPEHDEVLLYRLNSTGKYERNDPDADGNYSTPLLPGLVLHVPTLWQTPLPTPPEVTRAVEAMLSEAN